ncbi:alpha/beta hydrolase [Pararhizobium mangrovi]|uniref:Palmitoyl-protein thioesterase ABHD10, mitochondrial n=1 Tax=Pararhizobium mangrovi TaxID=2590452 RepID=A0A506U0T7_9HYPH|nr:alpha/beta hydrolase [Pararhizobium mangrovi]TPW26219.1 alpha/beta hydrolase [Pararhizobium mangrovi]
MVQPFSGETTTIEVGHASTVRRIAVRHRPGGSGGPGLVWLGGYRSDMEGTKAVELDRYAARESIACTRHDYSGHGASGGAFAEGTISRWLEESLAVFDAFTTGPQILVGSSMGGWIALRMAQELARRGDGKRIGGMLLLAPAPDFTHELVEPALNEEQRRALEADGYFEEPTPYGPEPNVFTKALLDDGRANAVLDGIIDTGCPVHILQGMEDPDVPYRHALRLVEHLPSDDVVLSLVRDGDHRLSRPEDLARMANALSAMIADLGGAR